MKSTAIILPMSLYPLATMGFSLKKFYRYGKLKATMFSLIQDAQQKCSKGLSTGCCDKKYQFFKVGNTYISPAKITNTTNHYIDIQTYTLTFSENIVTEKTAQVSNCTHAPPLFSCLHFLISNSVFKA